MVFFCLQPAKITRMLMRTLPSFTSLCSHLLSATDISVRDSMVPWCWDFSETARFTHTTNSSSEASKNFFQFKWPLKMFQQSKMCFSWVKIRISKLKKKYTFSWVFNKKIKLSQSTKFWKCGRREGDQKYVFFFSKTFEPKIFYKFRKMRMAINLHFAFTPLPLYILKNNLIWCRFIRK